MRGHYRYLLGLFVLGVSLSQAYIVGLYERKIVNLPSYHVTRANTLYLDIGHRFLTPLEEDGHYKNVYQNLLGMDGTANIAMAFSYGLGNLLDISLNRYGFTKLYLLSTRVNVFNEPVDRFPFSFSLEGNAGFRTQEGLEERQTYGGAAILAKDFFGEALLFSVVSSYQFKTRGSWDINPVGEDENTFAVGGNIGLWLDRWLIGLEYSRPISGYLRTDIESTITDNYGFSLKYRTYQHNFGITLSNHAYNAYNDMLAGALNNRASKSDLRFGFNITRELDFLTHDRETPVRK